jgi:hypothetical protein
MTDAEFAVHIVIGKAKRPAAQMIGELPIPRQLLLRRGEPGQQSPEKRERRFRRPLGGAAQLFEEEIAENGGERLSHLVGGRRVQRQDEAVFRGDPGQQELGYIQSAMDGGTKTLKRAKPLQGAIDLSEQDFPSCEHG